MEFIVGFSNPKNVKCPIYACLIKAVYDVPFSHVYIRFYSAKYDRWLVYESVGKGSRFIEYSKWKEHAEPYKEFVVEVTEDQRNKAITAFIDDLGNEYGVLQAIGLGIKALAKRWFRIIMRNPLPQKNEKICSEATRTLFIILGKEVPESEEIAPIDIYNYLLGKNNVK